MGHTSGKSVRSSYVFWRLKVTKENYDVSMMIVLRLTSGKSVRSCYVFGG